MAYAFADLLAVLGVWFSGITAPAATTSTTAPPVGRGAVHGRSSMTGRGAMPFDVRDRETVALVERAIRAAMRAERPPTRPEPSEAPAARPTKSELANAVARLFASPLLANLAAEQAASARALVAEAARAAEWQKARDFRFAAWAAERDEEETLILLLA